MAEQTHTPPPTRVSDAERERAIRALRDRSVEGRLSFDTQLRAAWRAPRLPRLALPAAGHQRLTIGRASDCDLMLADPSVSRHHAELRRQDEGWLLVDLGSTNGTRLNGWRIAGPVPVRPGDRVSFGALGFCIVTR